MNAQRIALALTLGALVAGCASAPQPQSGTLAELDTVEADVADVVVDDALDRAAASYRRFLQETTENARTPEAMRRLADLQIERAYGVVGNGDLVETIAPEMAAPEQAAPLAAPSQDASASPAVAAGPDESDADFERRAGGRAEFLAQGSDLDVPLVDADGNPVPTGPREAIETYKKILETYPDYERNDKVLYQMSRAYDEIGQPDEAMRIMDRLIAAYPYSRYVDEIHFRRGEYFFIRRQFLDAEDAYGAIIRLGATSQYYELGLYKLGWTFYKQELYEEALDNFIALLDYRNSIGFDFEQDLEENDEHRIADTFRVVSLSFSNLGDADVVNQYFAANGRRTYADKIYGNLGEFYFEKLRYDDATSVYNSFIELNPYHRVSPNFAMRVIEIYDTAGFPQLVVKSKKRFVTEYALDAAYWSHNDVAEAGEVVDNLQTNLTDLAAHYHSLYQVDELEDDRSENFSEASRWYRQLLASFPDDPATPGANYQLADLLLENENFVEAAQEYERTAYGYAEHEQASAAGYAAVYAYRQELDVATGARQRAVMLQTVDSSLRFANSFPAHDEVPPVLSAAADDLYELKDFERAIAAARQLIDNYPAAEEDLRRGAWAVVAHSSIDIAEYAQAEHAYLQVLAMTAEDDDNRPAVVDGLAASIYKQAEQANLIEDYRLAATHFLRIKSLAPTSTIRSGAEYDAAVALMKLEDWEASADVLEEFRQSHPEHQLNTEATKQLAHVYHEDGQLQRSAEEHERIAAESEDPELRRDALLTAAELYDEVMVLDEAIRVYLQYADEFPYPLDVAMESRKRVADVHRERLDYELYYEQLRAMVDADLAAGPERTDRSRYLGGTAALVLAEQLYKRFADLKLTQPFDKSLTEKQARMDTALAAFEALLDYEVASVASAATYYMAQIYRNFSVSLLQSERPSGMSAAEIVDYEMVLEEEAFPFEERAIEVHEQNHKLLASGIYNEWVQRSLDTLADLMPGRYAKNESSGGHLNSIDNYAYRMPVAPPPVPVPAPDGMQPDAASASEPTAALQPEGIE